jgi:hypothetical protein
MGIDPNIILGIRPAQIDSPVDSYAKALQISSLVRDRKKGMQEDADNDATRQAYKNHTVIGPDGIPKIDHAAVVADIAKSGNPLLAEKLDQAAKDHQKAQLEAQLKGAELTGQIMSQVTDQPSYDTAIARLKSAGMPNVDQYPKQYDPNFTGHIVNTSLTIKEQQAQKNKEKDQQIEQQKASTMSGERADKRNDKLAESFKKDLDADAGRTGNFGKISNTLINAQKLEGLASQYADGNLDSRQMEELSLGLANMLSGSGGAARSQVEALVPHTWTGKMANVQEWLTSDPTGTGQQKFVKRMLETVSREKEIAAGQLNKIREQRLTAHQGYAKSNPEQFNSQLRSYGMDPGNYDGNLLPKKKSQVPPSLDPNKLHDMHDDDIDKLYKQMGGK